MPRILPRLLPLLLLLLVAACGNTGSSSAFARHFDGEIWHEAYREQLGHPERVIPELGLLLATPIVYASDDEISEVAVPTLTGDSQTTGDWLAVGLGATVLGLGAVDGLQGDPAPIEIGAESLVATELATYALKTVTHRQRPDGSASDSFPSGHTSFSFAAATYIARYVEEYAADDYSALGYLAYGPAIYVGISRVENQRHFTSDVIFGAFLGMFLTNWIYDAHHAQPGETRPRPTIEERRRKVAWSIQPVLEGSELSLALRVSF